MQVGQICCPSFLYANLTIYLVYSTYQIPYIASRPNYNLSVDIAITCLKNTRNVWQTSVSFKHPKMDLPSSVLVSTLKFSSPFDDADMARVLQQIRASIATCTTTPFKPPSRTVLYICA